jgi:hypothetical protein
MIPRLALFVLGACATTIVNAQNVIEAKFDGQPLVYMKEGQVNGCGVRVIIVHVPAVLKENSLITAYDASFNLNSPGYGVVKAGVTEATWADFSVGLPKGKGRAIAPSKFWFKAPGAKATTATGKVISGDDPGTTLYATDVDPIIALLGAHKANVPILFGVTRPGVSTERIFIGAITMSDGERKQVANCLDELLSKK